MELMSGRRVSQSSSFCSRRMLAIPNCMMGLNLARIRSEMSRQPSMSGMDSLRPSGWMTGS